MKLTVPATSLIVLIGVSGSGKSSFAKSHFAPYEVLSSDQCRALVSGSPHDQSASADAFEVLEFIAGKRLAANRLTVIDATNVTASARKQWISLAKEHDVLPTAIVLDVRPSTAKSWDSGREHPVGPRVIDRQSKDLRRGIGALRKEGFRRVHVVAQEDLGSVEIVREPLLNDRRDLTGPFDVIGDVHGCRAELETLLERLGYAIERDDAGRAIGAHREGRTAVFVGDLVDRGPDTPGVLRLVMGMVAAGDALCVSGNHEAKLERALAGRQVRVSHGLAETLAQLGNEPERFREQVATFVSSLVAHYVLDEGRLVVAHAGLKEAYHGRASGRVRSFALYGDTTGESDEYGLPVRYPWANDYRGQAVVLYGHTPTPVAEWVNNTMCLDTGCVFGGSLTALRYPEREVVSVAAEREYFAPAKPLRPVAARADGELRLEDVTGLRYVETSTLGRIKIEADQAAGALEVMSRFALHPSRLPYLPPTMSPVSTSTHEGLLEHPDEAFAQYGAWGIDRVICETKHMGSRAVVLVRDDGTGDIWTRTGRPFFDASLTAQLLREVADAVARAGLWAGLGASWLLLDAEILPWSLKAHGLLEEQYLPVRTAAIDACQAAGDALDQAAARGLDVTALRERTSSRLANAKAFGDAVDRYCWPTNGLEGVEIAPFQVLASSAGTYATRDHLWHLDVADRLAAASARFRHTGRLVVEVADASSRQAGTEWWHRLTAEGGEGMVVKPLANLVRGKRGLVQPGLKVRGREYLRIIYGPDYTEPANLSRLRERSLGRKRSLALREYALGLEALERFVAGEPLWRVHEAVFGVLALESDPVDPRL